MKKVITNETQFKGNLERIWIDQDISDIKNKIFPSVGLWPIFDDDRAYNYLLECIENARQTICLASFLIADKKLETLILKKASEGVRVYVLTASDAQLKKVNKDYLTNFDKEALGHHIKLLNEFVGKVLCRTAGHLHAKFIIIDPVIDGKFNDSCIALVSTANFTDKALKISPEIIIEKSIIKGGIKAVKYNKQLYQFFLRGFWEEATEELLDKGIWSGISGNGKQKMSSIIGIPTTSRDNNSLREKIINILSFKGSIVLSAYTFDTNHITVKTLLESQNDITLFTRPKDRNYELFNTTKSNVNIFTHENVHAKFILTDSEAIVFTSNFGVLGLDEGFEIGILLDSRQRSALLEMIDLWKDKMEKKMYYDIDPNTLQNNLIVGLQDEFKVKNVKIIHERTFKNTIECKTIDEYIGIKPKSHVISVFGKEIILNKKEEITYFPPKLINKAKEQDPLKVDKTKFKTYKLKNMKYICFKNQNELDILLKNRSSIKDYSIVYKSS